MPAMTVGDLIEQLKQFDPNMRVVKSRDDEGNAFHYLWKLRDDSYIRKDENDSYYLDVACEEDITDFYNEDLSDWMRVLVVY